MDVFFPSAVCEDSENSGLISRTFSQALKELLGSVLGFFLALCHIIGESVFPNSRLWGSLKRPTEVCSPQSARPSMRSLWWQAGPGSTPQIELGIGAGIVSWKKKAR